MITLIKQRTPSDCMICCIAMATTISYETIMAAALEVKAFEEGVGTKDKQEVLKALGFTWKNGPDMGEDFVARYKPWETSPEYFRIQHWGRPTIFTVPSLNNEGGQHAVYYDGFAVFDPSNLNRYNTFDELMPTHSLIFRHGIIKHEGV